MLSTGSVLKSMVIGHKKQWEFLKKKFELNQLSHAYLFTGAEGIGKKIFAKEFAEFIGCKFPDLMVVGAAFAEGRLGFGEPKGEIKISQVREVQNFLAYKSYNGGYKAVIVDDAEKMNQEAQSCFLKTLEEPKGNTLLLLICSKPDLLLSTIFSRCQTVKFFKPKNLPINKEKKEKEDEILKNLLPVIESNLADKFKYVKSIDFDNQDLGQILEVLQKYYREKLLADFSQKKVINILNLIEGISKKLLFTNINPKLALEVILMET